MADGRVREDVRTVRVGLVGCGRIAQLIHLGVLTRLPGVRLAGIAEADVARLESASVRVPGVPAFTDYRSLLERPDIDAVVICLPTGMHAEAAKAAFARGKHVYLEKPLATGLEEARGVLEAWRRSGKVGAMGFNVRFHPLYRAAREQIRAGRVGHLTGARSIFGASARALPEWKQSRRTGGGVLLDLASHHADLVPFLFGSQVSAVSAAIRSVRSEEDTATLSLRLAEGMVVQSFVSMAAAEEDRFEVYGDEGKLTLDRYRHALEVDPPRRAERWQERVRRSLGILGRSWRQVWTVLRPRADPSFTAALRSFADAVRGGVPASPDLEDGFRSLAVIEAAEESARTRREVSLTHSLPHPHPRHGVRVHEGTVLAARPGDVAP